MHVIIGHENTNDAMHEVSLVFAPYGAPDRALGLLGVLGPTRMRVPARHSDCPLPVHPDERADQQPSYGETQ